MKHLASMVLLVIAVGATLVLVWSGSGAWLALGGELRAWLAGAGGAAPVVFVFVTAVLTGLGAPRLLFCSLAGWSFGFGWGLALSHLGSLLGAYAVFLLARRGAPERLLRKYPKLKTIAVPAGRGWWSVLWVRQLPVSGLYNDILLGWSPVSHRDFWIGSALGFLPLGVTACLVGAGAIQADLGRLGLYCAGAGLLFLLLDFGVKRMAARRGAA